MTDLWITVELMPGTNIPARAIPQLIDLANRLGHTVRAAANGVTVMAHPGDDPIDLAVAWDHELKSKSPHPVASAWRGAELRMQKELDRATSPASRRERRDGSP